jgi:hypothetical protein
MRFSTGTLGLNARAAAGAMIGGSFSGPPGAVPCGIIGFSADKTAYPEVVADFPTN